MSHARPSVVRARKMATDDRVVWTGRRVGERRNLTRETKVPVRSGRGVRSPSQCRQLCGCTGAAVTARPSERSRFHYQRVNTKYFFFVHSCDNRQVVRRRLGRQAVACYLLVVLIFPNERRTLLLHNRHPVDVLQTSVESL